jgi:hypothetical protein
MNSIESHIDKILDHYTKGDYYDLLIKAKEEFIALTGTIDEEANEYEARMNTFNDWFIFNYRREDQRRVIDDYIQSFEIEDELSKSLYNINFSVFQFVKINFKKQIVLKDILHNEKFIISKEDSNLALLEDDLFLGRIVTYNDKNHLLKGVTTLPREVLSILKKQSKKVRKLHSDSAEEEFLITLEKLKIKSLHYSHLNTNQVFIFD